MGAQGLMSVETVMRFKVLRILPTLVLLAITGRTFAADRIDFTRDIRPILTDNCFSCHGPDEKQRKAKLRLDTRDGAARVLVAGKPADSELIARITAEGASMRMPPPKSGK